jgi:hypothetical protein
MALFTHGTTFEGLKAILSGAGKSELANPWTVCDNDGQMYFYAVDKALDEWDTVEDALASCQRASMENARMQAAFTGKPTDVYVLTCEIDSDLLDDDYSCENMGGVASQMACHDFDIGSIISVHKLELSIWDYPTILACLTENELFNWNEVDSRLVELAKNISDFDSLYEHELEEISKEELASLNLI